MLVQCFKASRKDSKATINIDSLPLKFGLKLRELNKGTQVSILFAHPKRKTVVMMDFHTSRPRFANVDCKTLYGDSVWPEDFPIIDVGLKTDMTLIAMFFTNDNKGLAYSIGDNFIKEF